MQEEIVKYLWAAWNIGQAGIRCIDVKISKQRCKYLRAVMHSSTDGDSLSGLSALCTAFSSEPLPKSHRSGYVKEWRKQRSSLTWSSDVFQQAQNAVDGCIGENQRIVRVDENLENVQENIDLTRLAVLSPSVDEGFSVDDSKSAKQGAPARSYFRVVALDKLTDRSHNLSNIYVNFFHSEQFNQIWKFTWSWTSESQSSKHSRFSNGLKRASLKWKWGSSDWSLRNVVTMSWMLVMALFEMLLSLWQAAWNV